VNVIRQKKEKFVKELNKDFNNYESFYLVDFVNLPVSKAVELRRELQRNSYVFKVVKNRLALRALKEDFPEELKAKFIGPTALAFAPEDPVGLARLIRDFGRKISSWRRFSYSRQSVFSRGLIGKTRIFNGLSINTVIKDLASPY
jgi:ribosomal protein L10